MRELLSKLEYTMFVDSSQFMAVYDSGAECFHEFNDSMKARLASAEVGNIHTILLSENDIYLTLSGVPCRLRKLADLKPGLHMVELFPAHTKTWNQSSDLVQVTDLTSDGVWEWFPSLNFEYMSQRFWDILGYNQKEMEESPVAWMSFINGDDKNDVLKMVERHIDSRGEVPYHATVRYIHKNGHEIFVLCRGSVVDWLPDGKPWRLLGTHTDVTDIVKKDAVEAQSVFIARMSHEIRSPICTILNECELLQNEVKTKVITRTCQQLISLTDNILDLGKTKHDQVELVTKPVDLHNILTDCTKRHRLQAKKKGIRIRLSTGDLPDTVLMDEVRFNQIVDNLVSNAIKYSDAGVISVISVDVEYDADDNLCELRVCDEGHGIPAAMHNKVFEEFVQGNATMQGAGIGLTITKTLSKLMGGDVVIETSTEGVGTTMLFTSKLPLEEAVKETKNSLRILVVDDMVANRLILARRLANIKGMGINYTDIVEAVDGKDAYNLFKACKGNFQLILMDCLMPVVDGFEATVSIHDECSQLGIEPVPVVAVTASVSPQIREKCFQHGMSFVVTKPYTEQDLLMSVLSCMPKTS